jgi:hypothetical protein
VGQPKVGAWFKFALASTNTIKKHTALAALGDESLFAKAHIDALGGYVVWVEDELEMAADNLRNIAIKQTGGIGPEQVLNWMARHSLTQERAAQSIGVSRRMLNYYLSGAKPIPKTIWLACLGWEQLDGDERFVLAA